MRTRIHLSAVYRELAVYAVLLHNARQARRSMQARVLPGQGCQPGTALAATAHAAYMNIH